MKYCRNCVLPDTRPHLFFDNEGICNACRTSSTKPTINWEARSRKLRELVTYAKSRSVGYDCLIPVSGGKDSTWQVIKCLEYGFHPLCFTWRTPGRTALGQQNLDNLISLGVDHVDFQISPEVERVFMLKSLKKFGTTAIPMHMAIFSLPLTFAMKFNIPLIIWGENPAFEYGGTEEESKGFKLDERWFKKFGVTHGTTAEDWIDDDLAREALTPYLTSYAEAERLGIRGIFLGYYLPWDVETSFRAARERGFKVRRAGPKTGYYNYADIDDDFISIHHYLKWYKFGFTRLFDNLSLEIRNKRLTRAAALKIIKRSGDQTPLQDIKKLCRFLKITPKNFFEIAESFRNQEIWYREKNVWKIRDFLIPDWKWK